MLLFAFIGMIALTYYILLHILSPKKNGEYIIVVPVSPKKEHISALVYSARLRLGLFGGQYRGKVIVLDKGMDNDTKRLCHMMCAENSISQVCNADELANILRS